MKYLYLALIILFTIKGTAQNLAPIAVNDTNYVLANDPIQFPATVIGGNDSDPDGLSVFLQIDTAFYNGPSNVTFYFNTNFINSNPVIDYDPPQGFFGKDSIRYVIKDPGVPTMYDTAYLYIYVMRKAYEQLDINNVNARINKNVLFQDANNSIASFEVPKNSNRTTIYGANLWLTGKYQNEVYSSSETFWDKSETWWHGSNKFYNTHNGPIMNINAYPKKYDYIWDRVWAVTKAEVASHITDYNLPAYQMPEAILNWPAHGDTSKGQAYNLAPFYDNNGDGIYTPNNGDYPLIKGDKTVYYLYNDERVEKTDSIYVDYVNGAPIFRGFRIMRSEIHVMAYAYDCPTDSALNNTMFLNYNIYNRSNNTYDSTYVGFWTDFDIGGATDDYVACDVTRSTFYGHNGDGDDEPSNGILGYGTHPPAQGITFLKGAKLIDDGIDNAIGIGTNESPNGYGFGDGIVDNEHWGMESFMFYNNGGGAQGYPVIESDYYNLLSHTWLDGTPLSYGSSGYDTSPTATPTKYMFPNFSDNSNYGTNGIAQTPWWTAGSGGDTRGVGATGMVTFAPGDKIELDLAVVFGRDYQIPGNTAGIAIMQERVDSIRSFFSSGHSSACGSLTSIKSNKLEPNTLGIAPNPFTNQFVVNYNVVSDNAQLRIYNLMGEQLLSQTIINKTTAIDLDNQANGIYLITIIDGDKSISKKIVKR